jgi:hypothetical protein
MSTGLSFAGSRLMRMFMRPTQHRCWLDARGNLELTLSVKQVPLGKLEKILRAQTAYGEKWLSDLSQKQQRIVFIAAFMEHVGATTAEFLEFAGLRNPGDLERALAKTVRGQEALLEKVGSRYRFRSRFVQIWFALNFYRVQALIHAMRTAESYRRRLATVLPDLPKDPLTGLLP